MRDNVFWDIMLDLENLPQIKSVATAIQKLKCQLVRQNIL